MAEVEVVPTRTFGIEYSGSVAVMDQGDLFDEIVDVFEKYGLKIEGASDGPTGDMG